MNMPTREEQKRLVRLWDETGRALEAIRNRSLRGKPYDWEEVDALLALGEAYTGPKRTPEGMLEIQCCFNRWAERLGWERKS